VLEAAWLRVHPGTMRIYQLTPQPLLLLLLLQGCTRASR